ncbi:MAG: PEGA domain-containing protein [Deltaproteobacteria bacterium]|nr:PEGA domain-containing protein [Deltaproteobacteria bacterium]
MRALIVTIVAGQLLGMAAAQGEPTGDAAADAQVHLDRGIAAFEAGDYTTAHRELAAASELAPAKPNPYRWLALTEIQLGDCARAVVNIEHFLSRVPAEDPRRAEMQRLQGLCARTGVLSIRTTPPAVSLRIDGAHVGRTPYRAASLAVGAHRLAAEEPGYEPLTRSVVVSAGSELELHLELSRTRTSIIRRWWFVPAVVVGAAVVTGAIILVVREPDSTSTLPPIHCDGASCLPGGG